MSFVQTVGIFFAFTCGRDVAYQRLRRVISVALVKQWCSNFLARGPHLSGPCKGVHKVVQRNRTKWALCKPWEFSLHLLVVEMLRINDYAV